MVVQMLPPFWIGFRWLQVKKYFIVNQWGIFPRLNQATEKPDNLFKASFTSIVQTAPDEVLKIPYRYA